MALARWQATIVDEDGTILPGASVEVRQETGGSPLAVLFSDRAGVTSIGNPFVADAEGFAAFHTTGGAYKIIATSGAFSRTWRYVAVGTMAEQDSNDVAITGGDISGVDLGNVNIVNGIFTDGLFLNAALTDATITDFLDFLEVTLGSPEGEPGVPDPNTGRVYAVDDGSGITKLNMKDAASNVVQLSHFVQPFSAAVTRTQQNKLRDIFDARDFGIVGDGTTDDTGAINAALAALNSIGGGVLEFPAGFNCKITGQIGNSYADVMLRGKGGDTFHNIGSNKLAATRFTWGGATDNATAMVLISSPFNAANQVLNGGGIEGIMLDCNRVKGIGLQVLSRRQLVCRNIFILDATNRAYYFNCGVTGTDHGEDSGNQDCLFERLMWRSIDDASVFSAHGLYLAGSSNANTSFNKFLNCDGVTQNGTGYILDNADNNVFEGCRSFAIGTGLDFDLFGTTAAGSVGGACNYFIGCSWSSTVGKFTVRGTEAGYTAGTVDNVLVTEDIANSSSAPVLGTGCAIIRPTKGAALSVKGITGNAAAKVQDIAGTADQALRVNGAGTALAFGAIDLTKAAAAVSAWTDYTPTFTSAAGTLGTQTLNRSRFQQNGKRVHVYIDVSITSAGTGPSGFVRMTLPVAGFNAGIVGLLNGYDLTTGNLIGGYVDGTNARANASFNAGVFAGGNGGRLLMAFTYEAA